MHICVCVHVHLYVYIYICADRYVGENCEYCQLGYYGIALAHDCQSKGVYICDNDVSYLAFVGCSCYLNGTVPNTYCHLTIGQCVCEVHVEGKQCNQCSHGYWNIDSGEGYMDFDCSSIGSNSSVMLHSNCFNDLFLSLQFTGQCNCRKGYDGKMVCAQCKDVH